MIGKIHIDLSLKPSLEYDEILEHQNDKESEDELDVFLPQFVSLN